MSKWATWKHQQLQIQKDPTRTSSLSPNDQERGSLVRHLDDSLTKQRKKMWPHSHSYQQRPSEEPRHPPLQSCNEAHQQSHEDSVKEGHAGKRDLNSCWLITGRLFYHSDICRDPMGSLDFHSHLAVTRFPSHSPQRGSLESPGGESRLSPLRSGIKAIPNVSIEITRRSWDSHLHSSDKEITLPWGDNEG